MELFSEPNKEIIVGLRMRQPTTMHSNLLDTNPKLPLALLLRSFPKDSSLT
jgi:hypothetical protein